MVFKKKDEDKEVKEKKDDVKADDAKASSSKKEAKAEEKKEEPKPKKEEKVEEPKKAAKAEAVVGKLEKVQAESKKDRKVIAANPCGGGATLEAGGQRLKVKCYLRRRDKATIIGIGPKAVELNEWLEGKADLVA